MLTKKSEVNKLVHAGDKILLAVSGGLDSMCLLHIFIKLQKELNIKIAVVTVNHNLRGEESDKDAALVECFCNGNGIEFLRCDVNVDHQLQTCGHNVESEARKLRYEAFSQAKEALCCNKIATAHHADDNAETVLFNIFRGAGLKGASGIAETRKDIIRPLLKVTRSELSEYAACHKIEYREDMSNFDTGYTRNFLRREIIPRLKKHFPAVVENINNFSARAGLDEDYIESGIHDIEVKNSMVSVPLEYYNAESTGMRATRRALNLLGLYNDISAKNYRDAVRLAKNTKGAVILFRQDIIAKRDYDCLHFYKNEGGKIPDFEIEYGKDIIVTPSLTIKIEKRVAQTSQELKNIFISRAPGELFFDAEKVPIHAVWRNRRQGDRFCKFGGGTKKLNDYMTDIKMPDNERDSVPLLAADSEILLIAGYEVSEKLKVTGKRMLCLRPYTEDKKE